MVLIDHISFHQNKIMNGIHKDGKKIYRNNKEKN
jgi:hypothetical protein